MKRSRSITALRQDSRNVGTHELGSDQSNESDAFAEPTQEAIRERAYQLFVQRGSGPGSESEDWAKAELELKVASTRPRKN